MKKIAIICSVLGGIASTAVAGLDVLPTRAAYSQKSAQCFYAGETSFDAISIYVDPTGTSNVHGGDAIEDGFGGGLGLTHFITDSFGVRGGAYWFGSDSTIHSVTASGIIRYPLEKFCLAPYVFGGVGGHFDSVNQISAHLGAGVEYRITDRLGLIADYSHTFTDETEDWNMYSLGVRVRF